MYKSYLIAFFVFLILILNPIISLTNAQSKVKNIVILCKLNAATDRKVDNLKAKSEMQEDSMCGDIMMAAMKNQNYTVVEREYLDELLREQGLASIGVVASKYAVNIGKIDGADAVYLTSARPEIWKNEITWHQKNKIPVAATLG